VPRVIRYGLNPEADVQGKILGCDSDARYQIEIAGQEIQLRLPGQHNIYNALAAAAVGLEFGVPMQSIKQALEEFEPVEKRMHILHLKNQTVVLDDSYNANPTSCAAALATLIDLKRRSAKRQFVVMGDMLELGEFAKEEHKKLGRQVAEMGCAGFYGFGSAMTWAVEEAKNCGMDQAWHFDDQEQLWAKLIQELAAGDHVLVKGSRAMHMENITEGLKKMFGEGSDN